MGTSIFWNKHRHHWVARVQVSRTCHSRKEAEEAADKMLEILPPAIKKLHKTYPRRTRYGYRKEDVKG